MKINFKIWVALNVQRFLIILDIQHSNVEEMRYPPPQKKKKKKKNYVICIDFSTIENMLLRDIILLIFTTKRKH